MEEDRSPPTQIEIKELLSAGNKLYEILEIKENATSKEIVNKYREMAKQYHPDKAKGDPEMNNKMARINGAYRILSNPRYRFLYDTYIKNNSRLDSEDGGGYSYESPTDGEDQSVVHMAEIINFFFWDFISQPFNRVASYCHSISTNVSTKSEFLVYQSLKRNRGLRGFWDGFYLNWLKYGVGCISTMVFGTSTLGTIAMATTTYPFNLISMIRLSTLDKTGILSTLSLIKNANSSSILKGLFYGFSSYAALTVLEYAFDHVMDRLQKYAFKKYMLNPESKFWRYSESLLRFNDLRSLVYVALICPLRVITAHHQLQAIMPIAQRLPLISIVKNIYSIGGISSFYNGWISAYQFYKYYENRYSL
eukprot:gene1396-1765_t